MRRLTYHMTARCDTEHTPPVVAYVEHTSEVTLGSVLHQLGWTRADGRDLCPECSRTKARGATHA